VIGIAIAVCGTRSRDTPSGMKNFAQMDKENDELRYLAYASRLKNFVKTGTRYLAYTSDVGEAFRPVVNPWLVRSAYGLSFAYVGYDISFHVIQSKNRNEPQEMVARTFLQRTIFQGLASLLLPAITIHTVVDVAAKQLKNTRYGKFGPTFVGLAVLPLLPVVYDEPIEHGMEILFDKVWPRVVSDKPE
jgi:fission process protein 1